MIIDRISGIAYYPVYTVIGIVVLAVVGAIGAIIITADIESRKQYDV